MSTLAVVEDILRHAEVPMSVREIVERAGETLPTKSKTPDTVVARDLSMDIKKKGEGSIFIRTAPGRYAVREVHMRRMAEQQATAPNMAPAPQAPPPNVATMVAMEGERAGMHNTNTTDGEPSASA